MIEVTAFFDCEYVGTRSHPREKSFMSVDAALAWLKDEMRFRNTNKLIRVEARLNVKPVSRGES